ncbi:PKD domain-containing protein, partial [Bacteroidia bacterium]|nr:PKD domain-containing protein [Bacteroidia bacterium]
MFQNNGDVSPRSEKYLIPKNHCNKYFKLKHICTMLKFKIIFISITLISLSSKAQKYFANGDATYIGGDCYQLTTEANNKGGTVWYADKLDLKKSFDLEFLMNFGRLDAPGADGIVFVLQRDSNTSLGTKGGGMGYSGLSPSLGIEFDTYYNRSVNDPSFDHMSIFKNGVIDHASSNCLTSTVAASATSINIEDRADHLVRVQWNAGSKTIKVWFDCYLRLTLIYDIQAQIFNNNSDVYWGFTAATGGAKNRHIVCLREDILVPDTLQLCSGDSIYLNAKVSENNIYKWSPSIRLSNDSIKNPICFTTTSRYYYVNYINKCGRAVTDSLYINVADKPQAQFTIDDSLECFRDHEIVVINKSTLAQGAVQSRTWTTDGKDYLNIDTLNEVYPSANDYTIQLTIESDQGCFDSLTKAVTIYPMPVAQFTTDTTRLCERGNVFTIDYQGAISSGSISKLWSFGDGVSSTTADDTTKSYSTFGSYPVRLELVSGFDCRDTIEQILTVHAQPQAQFTIDDSLECFRDHEIVVINKSTLAQGAVQSRTWTTDGKDYLNIDTLNQVYPSANDYTIQLTIESDQGCFDSLTKAVTIYPMPVAQFTTDDVCLGKLTSFENLSNFEFGTMSSYWSFGDGNTSNEESPFHKYSSADSFDVTLIVSTEKDCTDTIEYKKIAVIHPVPTAAFDYKKIKSWKKETQYLFSDSSIGADFLRWKIDGFSESNEDDFQFIFQDSGTREVTLIAINEFSCSDTTSQTISVFPDLIYYIPNAITPNGDGLNDVFNVVGLGYADMYNLKIYNRWGELLFESNKISEGWDGRFMGDIVQNGVYIYLVTFRDIGSKKRIFKDGNV